jgi:N-acetylmuramoyl-L-alanine amidase
MKRRALFQLMAGGLVRVTATGLLPLAALHSPAFAQSVPKEGGERRSARPVAKPRVVMLDPGHGGHDPGAIGAQGTFEKDVTLDVAREVARQMVIRNRGLKVILTREKDVFLGLDERVRAAREAEADLFISIHADSAPNPRARGLSAYTLSEKASDEFAAAIATQENLAERLEVGRGALNPTVQAFLVDLVADHTKRASLLAKQTLIKGVGRDLPLLENPMRYANFAVLKAPDVPSVLIETGFLSNASDEKVLRDPGRRRQVAGVLAREMTALMTMAPFA